jgi:hypothetical protein
MNGFEINELKKLRKTLAKIGKLAGEAVGHQAQEQETDEATNGFGEQEFYACTLKSLPKQLLVKAADTAVEINPMNAPLRGMMSDFEIGLVSDPQFIAVLTTKYWGPAPRRLSVSFMESTPSDLRRRIVSHLNAWTKTGGIEFVETQGAGEVRISRGPGGYWSYLGTDILQIPRNRQTMNLQGFIMNTPESEYKRVIRHEAGHTLGFPHEHMRQDLVARIDPNKAYEYFWRTQGWNRAMVDQQVLTPLNEASLLKTPADQTSIMCYQLPGSITRNGQPIIGGLDINQTDFDFVKSIYPKPVPHSSLEPDLEKEIDWEAEFAAA